MFKRPILIGTLVAAGAGLLCADVSYEQTSKITGGMMAGAMRVAGAFSKQLREPMVTKVMLKGDRMVSLSHDSAHIIDLGKETITEINFQKKTYSVMTFAQMQQAMEQLAQKMKQDPNMQKADIGLSASVKNTGQSRQINGLDAKEQIITVEMETTDPQTGNKATMVITTDMWLASGVPGYQEVRNFYRRMAEKMTWAPGMAGMFNRPDMMKGMSQMNKEAAKLEGTPVQQIVRMGMKGEVTPAAAGGGTQAQGQQPQMPSAKEAAGGAAAGAATSRMGRLGGIAGGLGGLGRKKKQQAEEPPPPPPPQETATQKVDAPPGSLMEMTIDTSGFSSSVDASKFEVPAGFKQVESELVKATRK